METSNSSFSNIEKLLKRVKRRNIDNNMFKDVKKSRDFYRKNFFGFNPNSSWNSVLSQDILNTHFDKEFEKKMRRHFNRSWYIIK